MRSGHGQEAGWPCDARGHHPHWRCSPETGIDADAREAVAFALLAYAHLMDLPNNLPQATGARSPARLGKLCLPPDPVPLDSFRLALPD